MSYKIAAEIVSNGGQDCIEAKRRIIVRRPPFEMKTGHNLESAQEIKDFCCIDKGKADMKVNFEKNAYTPYETAKCFVEVNNTECKIPIENVTFKLKRAVTAIAKGHNLQLEDLTLATQTFPGVGAGESKPKEHLTLDLNNARESDRYMLKKQR